jgi:hypothetical protein
LASAGRMQPKPQPRNDEGPDRTAVGPFVCPGGRVRRIRDSNSWGGAPNTLSKCSSGCSGAAVCVLNCGGATRRLVSGRCWTGANATKTATSGHRSSGAPLLSGPAQSDAVERRSQTKARARIRSSPVTPRLLGRCGRRRPVPDHGHGRTTERHRGELTAPRTHGRFVKRITNRCLGGRVCRSAAWPGMRLGPA